MLTKIKSKIAKNKWYIAIFVAAFAVMMFYQFVWTSADKIPSNDSYSYLAKAAILQRSGLDAASYTHILPFTYWHMLGADNTLGFDYFMIVLTAIFTSIQALKVYIALLFAAMALIFARLLKYPSRDNRAVIALVFISVVGNIAFFLKFIELRPLVYSIILYFLALVLLLIYRRRYWLLAPLAFVMTMIHTSVFLLFIPIFILFILDIKSWRNYLLYLGYIFGGIFLAILVFPGANFYQILAVQPIIPIIYKTIPYPIDGAFEVKGDLTNPTYLVVSNLINLCFIAVLVILYVLHFTGKRKLKLNLQKSTTALLFLLFFALDLFSRRFSDYLTPTMLLFVYWHWDDIFARIANLKPLIIKFKTYLSIATVIGIAVFGVLFYNRFLKDNLTNTDYQGNMKSNLPETYATSQFINANIPVDSIIYNDAWEDFPYLIYYSQNYRYAAGMELGFMYMYDSEMLRFYQDFRTDSGFEIKNNELIYKYNNTSIKTFIKQKFTSSTILVKKGKGEKMSNYLLENYQKIGLSKTFEDEFYTIYQF